MSLFPSPPSASASSTPCRAPPPPTVIQSRTMAKLLFFVAVLLVASAVLAEAKAVSPTTAPAPAPGHRHGHGHERTLAPALAPTLAKAVAPTRAIYKKSATFSLKFIIHNIATRNVTFKLAIQGKDAGAAVVAKAGQWTAIGPLKVDCKVAVVQVMVTVKTNKGLTVVKTFPVQLAAFLKHTVAKSSKALVLTAGEVKSWRGDLKLVITVGRKVMLIVKL